MDTEAIEKQIDVLMSGLEALRKLLQQGLPQFPEEKQELLDKQVCLVCGRPLADFKTRDLRGDHEHCYRQVKRAIDDGEISEFEAIEKGLLAPKEPGGRRKADNALRDLLAAKAKKEAKESAQVDALIAKATAMENATPPKKKGK